jgi:hypothetical protein
MASLTRTALRLAGMPVAGTRVLLRTGAALERDVREASFQVAERAVLAVADEVMSRPVGGELVDLALSHLESSRLAQRVAARLLEDGIIEEIAERALAGPEAGRVLAVALRSRLLDEAVPGLLETDGLWRLVDEVARSPSVLKAVEHQGLGFVDEVGAGARNRSRRADAWVERLAGRMTRREGEESQTDVSAQTSPATRPPDNGP